MNFINFNGKIVEDGYPVLMASNRSFRYGDGLFETLRITDGIIMLAVYHFERLFTSLTLLKFEIPVLFTASKLEKEIIHLCQKNKSEKSGRVRLSVFRGNGGIYDEDQNLQYLIESWPLNNSFDQLNENGLIIGVFQEAKKSVDRFSNIKSANFLPYSLAALYAKENKLNDCLVMNSSGNIADATIANLFIINQNIIYTPSLKEGCINGVMRRHLVKELTAFGYSVKETVVSIADLEKADEVFLSNAISGIRWVKEFGPAIYSNKETVKIYNQFIKTIRS